MISKIFRIYGETTAMRILTVLVAVVAAFLPVSADESASGVEVVDSGLAESDTVMIKAVPTLEVAGLLETCPLSPLDILRPEARRELVRKKTAVEDSGVLNSVYTFSRIDTIADNYLKLHLTDVSWLTINLIDVPKKSPVVMTVYTVGGKNRASDSDIEFYDTDWNQLERKKFWTAPKVTDFLTKGTDKKADLKKIAELIPFPTYELVPSEDGHTIKGFLTVGEFLSEESNASLEPYRLSERVWTWNGKKFEIKKLPK